LGLPDAPDELLLLSVDFVDGSFATPWPDELPQPEASAARATAVAASAIAPLRRGGRAVLVVLVSVSLEILTSAP
jgi:hypothetical protein